VRQIITRIDDELHRKLKRKAADEGRSMNRVVTEALEHAVETHETPREAFERKARQQGSSSWRSRPIRSRAHLGGARTETRGIGPVFSELLAENAPPSDGSVLDTQCLRASSTTRKDTTSFGPAARRARPR
jgi:plasmid stability protein